MFPLVGSEWSLHLRPWVVSAIKDIVGASSVVALFMIDGKPWRLTVNSHNPGLGGRDYGEAGSSRPLSSGVQTTSLNSSIVKAFHIKYSFRILCHLSGVSLT